MTVSIPQGTINTSISSIALRAITVSIPQGTINTLGGVVVIVLPSSFPFRKVQLIPMQLKDFVLINTFPFRKVQLILYRLF